MSGSHGRAHPLQIADKNLSNLDSSHPKVAGGKDFSLMKDMFFRGIYSAYSFIFR